MGAEPKEVRDRVELRKGDLFGFGESGFDAVCCHGVLMYLPSRAEGWRRWRAPSAPVASFPC